MARDKSTQPAADGAAHGKANGLSNMEAVRRALAALGPKARPPEIGAYVQQHFGRTIPPNHISSYKSTLTKKARKPGRPRADAERHAGATDGLSLKDIRAIKELANRIGVSRFRELVEVLYQ
ncbi:MAG TPA: hypothetical protein VFE78_28930 [Gemmataceae bacterium]|jgi:hypothetical protein|nr:hypothetical protein [Gemmataceae bacterium]